MFTTNNPSSSLLSSSNNSPLVISLQHDTDGNLMEADSVESVLTRSDNTNQSSNSSSSSSSNITSMNQQTITNQLPLLREQSSIYTLQVEPVPNSSTTKLCLISKYERDIPVYLMVNNCTFEKLIKEQQKNATIHSVNIDILRKIALLIRRAIVTDFEKSIWLTHLQCGTGTSQLCDVNKCPRYSPFILRSIILSTKIIDISETSLTNETYMIVVQTYLQQLESRKQQYATELIKITKNITNYHLMIEPIIEKFIRQQLYPLHIETIYRIKFICCEYEINRLKVVLDESNLENNQMYQITLLCHSLKAYEQSKQELLLLTHCVEENKDLLKMSDMSNRISLSLDIKMMKNTNIRQQFIEQHRKNLNQYQNSIQKSLLDLAKIHMNDKQKLYDDALTNFKQNQQNLPLCQQFNGIIRNTIDLLLLHITESLRALYQLKTFALLGKIPIN
ncbi:unnamed protein product [Adineta steineri]|uniref:Uncharacterized protein n=1 Tax=Adineta steineri TaxID=433720 RepID=A0A815KGX6_9BILA|nr:unnamed protein product [Adineta steineri]CAF1393020.1 unnamed protein product [Adineta steineri]CAF1611703.1 unnamed protein product [Adineta steineri]CAF1611752.1 unnamed protein product [Adineta steineri]